MEEGLAGGDFGGVDTTAADNNADPDADADKDADKDADADVDVVAANHGAVSTTTAFTDEVSATAAVVAKAERRRTVRIVGLRGPLVDRAVACARKVRVFFALFPAIVF